MGLYKLAKWSGHCYGFYGTNQTFNPWPAIKDQMWSQWNGGTSGKAAFVYAYNNYTGSYLCTRYGTKKSWSGQQRARSNNWKANSRCG